MRKLSILVVLLALAAAACAGGDTIVATVNGTDISLAEVEALSIDADAAPRQEFNQALSQLILEEVLRQAGRDLGVAEDQAAIDAFYTEFVASVEAQGTLEEFLETNGITEEALRHYAYQQVYFPALQAKLLEDAPPITEEALQSAYLELPPDTLNQVCSRHILVATETEAADVITRLDAGDDFGELAGELSIDPGSGANGGEIGCLAEADMRASFVAPYTDAALEAPVGEVVGPVESEFGFHVMIVDSRQSQPFEELRDQLEQQLSSDQAATLTNDWFIDTMTTAVIEVDDRYGVWQTEPEFGVVTPG